MRGFRNKRKGFGNVASTLILFIAVIGLSTGLVIAFQNYMSQTQSSLSYQNDLTVNKLRTSFSVSYVHYDFSEEKLLVYVKNVGQSRLRPQNFDVFIDGEFVLDFEAKNPSDLDEDVLLLDPQRTLVLIFDRSMSSGTHNMRIISEFGVGISEDFNI